MAKYPLEKLIGLRAHRMDEAQRNKQLTEKKLEQGIIAVKNKEKEIVDYKKWKEEEAQRRYDSIMYKKLSNDQFEKFKQDISNLNIGELKLIDEKHELEKQVEELKEEVKKAAQVLKEMSAELHKIEEHKKIWLEMQRIELERKEESELEDFHAKKLY